MPIPTTTVSESPSAFSNMMFPPVIFVYVTRITYVIIPSIGLMVMV